MDSIITSYTLTDSLDLHLHPYPPTATSAYNDLMPRSIPLYEHDQITSPEPTVTFPTPQHDRCLVYRMSHHRPGGAASRITHSIFIQPPSSWPLASSPGGMRIYVLADTPGHDMKYIERAVQKIEDSGEPDQVPTPTPTPMSLNDDSRKELIGTVALHDIDVLCFICRRNPPPVREFEFQSGAGHYVAEHDAFKTRKWVQQCLELCVAAGVLDAPQENLGSMGRAEWYANVHLGV